MTELTFAYDDHGYLKSVTDKDGKATTFSRDPSGSPTGVVGPFGQTTTLTPDSNGAIVSVSDPLSRKTAFSYDPGTGFLSIITDPKGGVQKFDYTAGRLTQVTDPTGYSEQYGRSPDNTGYSVSAKSTAGRVTTYSVHAQGGNTQQRGVVLPDQAADIFNDALEILSSTAADGTKTTTFMSPDPAFGAQSLFPTQISVVTPAGRTLTSYPLRAKQLTDINNALTVQEWSEQVETNNRITQTVYKKSDQSLTVTSPMGRISTTTINAQGRPSDIKAVGLASSHYDYDSSGRVTKVTEASGSDTRTRTFQYDGSTGLLAAETDSLGHTVSYSRDAAGRLTELTRPDKNAILWSLDDNDNVLSLTPPSRSAHQFSYTSDDLLQTSTPPAIGSTATGQTSYSYTNDLDLQSILRSDGRSIAFAYDTTTGLLSTQTLGSATLTFGYDPSGALTSINRSDGVKVTQTFDGPLWTGTTWSGAIKGSVAADYDANFWLSSITVNNASTVNFTYDNDGLIVAATDGTSTMTLSRDADTGLVSGSALGSVTTTEANNAFGELTAVTANVSAASAFGQTLTRDSLGRVTHISETIGTTSHALDFTYDNVGRLTEEKRDGVATDYTYDANGNRTAVNVGGVQTIAAIYDAQDRIQTYGSQTCTFTANGDLLTRTSGTTSLTLTYDELGNLMKADGTDGTTAGTKTITYAVDGFGRRVARQVNGGFDRAWLYRDSLRPVSEVDNAGIFSHYVYLTDGGAPDFMIRSGVPYRFVKDHLGSVRLVVNAQTGAVAQAIEYDAFGRVLGDSNEGFQPFGFAGGLHDPYTALVRFGARDYDPGMGRWTNKDPIGFAGGDTNIYAYAANDPVNLVDPTGLRDWSYDEVQKYLTNYREDLLSCRWLEKKYLQYTRSKENGLADFHYTKLNKGDRFDITGAGDFIDDGEMGNFVAGYAAGVTGSSLDWWLVRMAGSFYNLRGAGRNKPKYPGMPSYSVDYFGIFDDDWGSYFYIEAGYRRGRMDTVGHP